MKKWEIDAHTLSMVCDEETEDPKEKQIPLSVFKGAGEFFGAIREFVWDGSRP